VSRIQWTDETWNPVVGCTKVSTGCLNCYAETMAVRLRGMGKPQYQDVVEHGNWTGKISLVEDALTNPLRWRKARMVFVCSMSDLFHPDVPLEFIDRAFAVMALCPQHTFQILTKRPERMAEYFGSRDWGAEVIPAARDEFLSSRPGLMARLGEAYSHEDRVADCEILREEFERRGGRALPQGWPFANVWLGTSIEDQRTADERIPHLLRCPAAVRFLSCEPLLGPVSVYDLTERTECPVCGHKSLHSREPQKMYCGLCAGDNGRDVSIRRTGAIDWVIVGGESGPRARPCNVEWIRSILEQCRAAQIPAFVKQLGARSSWPYLRGPRAAGPGKNDDPDEWPKDLRVREWPQSIEVSE
jgi:protein gp37